MKKGITLIAILLVLSCFSAFRKENTAARDSARAKDETGEPGVKVDPHVKAFDFVDTLLSWPEGVGALAVILTLGAIVWQSDETRRAAKAAEAGLQYTIDKERARLSVEINFDGFVAPSEWAAQEYPELAIAMSLRITNRGSTPAFNPTAYSRLVVVRPNNDWYPLYDKNPKEWTFADEIPANSEPILIEVSGTDDKRYPILSDADDIETGRAVLHLYGYVAFTDGLGKRRRQPFRWVWEQEGEYIDGQWQEMSSWRRVDLKQDQSV